MKPPVTADPSRLPNQLSTERLLAGADHVAGSRRGRPSLEEAQRLPARILEAGWEVLAQHGFEGFTFDRIARHARIGKATIYNRFSGKHEFLAALVKHKVEQRRVFIMAIGVDLPLIEGFRQRAVAVVRLLLSPEGLMMERLVDWCDQEFSGGQFNYRHAMFEPALASIESELREAASKEDVRIRDFTLAARFWVEGLLGHVRLMGTAAQFDEHHTERWARDYSEFFFAGLRG